MAPAIRQERRRAQDATTRVLGENENATNQAQTTAMVQEMRDKLAEQLQVLHTERWTALSKQQQVMAAGMVKLSKSIKCMTVSEFNALYKCDLLHMVQAGGAGNTSRVVVDNNKKRDHGLVVETPSAAAIRSRPVGGVAQTPSRSVRRGELLFSKNGTPILDQVDPTGASMHTGALVATITKKKRRDRGELYEASSPEIAAQFEINLGDGTFVSLNNPNAVQDLDASMKDAAFNQLTILQDQVEDLMKQLKK